MKPVQWSLHGAVSALVLASAFGLAGCSGSSGNTAEDCRAARGDATPAAAGANIMLLPASSGVCGVQLWKTDGTEAGTVLVKNINTNGSSNPGVNDPFFPFEFVFLNGAWYFAADDGVTGRELWKSDGSEAGTVRVKDIAPGRDSGIGGGASGRPFRLAVFNNELYFPANDGVTGTELWKSDGTEVGTVRVKDINPGPASSFAFASVASFAVFNNALYFAANDGVSGSVLWKTDGTESGTVRVKNIALGGVPIRFTVSNNAVYFVGNDGATGYEPWKTDGTEAGTVRVKDINPSGDSFPSGFTVFNDALYFSANDGVTGDELWKTDGTEAGTVRVKDISPSRSSAPEGFAVFNNALYFAADDGVTGKELWKSDGTEAGTVRVKDINPGVFNGPVGSHPFRFRVFNNALYFSASGGVTGTGLWKTDGTEAGTLLVKKDINVAGSLLIGLVVFNNALYFQADDGATGNELWTSDGTAAGTMPVKDICPGSCDGLFVQIVTPG